MKRERLEETIQAASKQFHQEGWQLPLMLSCAVPLWILKYRDCTPEERQEVLKDIDRDDFCCRLEYLLHRGPRQGDSARAFNDLARAIAVLSFCPGGVHCFGQHYEANKMCVPNHLEVEAKPKVQRERLPSEKKVVRERF